jgi:hypothetical protein
MREHCSQLAHHGLSKSWCADSQNSAHARQTKKQLSPRGLDLFPQAADFLL